MKQIVLALLSLCFFLTSCSKSDTQPGKEDTKPEMNIPGKLSMIDSFKTDLPGNWAIASVSGLSEAELDKLKKYDSAAKRYYPVLTIGDVKPLHTVPETNTLGKSGISVGCNFFSFHAAAGNENKIAFAYSNVTGMNCPAYHKSETIVSDALAKARSYTLDKGLKLFDEHHQLLLTAYALKPSAVK